VNFLSLALSVLKDIFWLIVRIFKKRDEPNAQLERAKSEDAKIIVIGDEKAMDAKMDDLTNRL
jgi:hypothetical protein